MKRCCPNKASRDNCDSFYEKDRGYAWVIVIFSFFLHLFEYGVSWSVGVFFVLFLDAFQASKGVTAWPGSLNTATMYLVGPISSMLTNKFGCRPTIIVGGVISAIGIGLSAVVTNIYHLYITFGIVTGIGFGIAYLPGIVIVSQYFEKKRTIAIGLAASGIGFGSFIYPPMIDALNNYYGWRGALLLLAGITLNICVAGSFMRPFKSKVDETEVKVKERIFNVAIFRSLNYLFLCLNNFLFCLGLSAVYIHLAEYAIVIGLGVQESTMLFSVLGIANLFGRFMYGFIGSHPLTNDILVYSCSFFICGIITVLIPFLTHYGTLLAYSSIFGLCSASFGILLPGIICQFLGSEELATGYGVLMTFESVGTLLGGPAAGFMYDMLHSYDASFFVGGGLIVISALCMIVPYLREKWHPLNTLEMVNNENENMLTKNESNNISKPELDGSISTNKVEDDMGENEDLLHVCT